jgi:hypothetical protein
MVLAAPNGNLSEIPRSLLDAAAKVPEGHKVRARPRVEVRKGAPKSRRSGQSGVTTG